MAKTELGQKLICPNDQTKFYDLNRRPAVCPKCGNSFDPEEVLRNRRVRSRAPDYESEEEKPKVVEVAEGFEDEADETPEIDAEAVAEPLETDDEDAAGPDAVAPAPDADIGVDFAEDSELEEEADDVPFLEDEDDEDFPDDEIEGIAEEDEEGR